MLEKNLVIGFTETGIVTPGNFSKTRIMLPARWSQSS